MQCRRPSVSIEALYYRESIVFPSVVYYSAPPPHPGLTWWRSALQTRHTLGVKRGSRQRARVRGAPLKTSSPLQDEVRHRFPIDTMCSIREPLCHVTRRCSCLSLFRGVSSVTYWSRRYSVTLLSCAGHSELTVCFYHWSIFMMSSRNNWSAARLHVQKNVPLNKPN